MKDIFRLVFHAFILWSFVRAFTPKTNPSGITIDKIDRVVSRVTIVTGAIAMLSFLIRFFDEDCQVSMMAMAFGKYWLGFWTTSFTYVVLLQSLWIEAIRKNKVVRIILALWILLLLHVELFIILITSFHRDYFPATW